jgi:type IV pilus assembly protein PilV
MRYPSTSGFRKTASGFTLLEVLIAILVLAFGLLGLAGLQGIGLLNNKGAYLRSTAILQAYDMGDRMRANKTGMKDGDYDGITTTIPSDPGCITTGCTPAQLEQYDAHEWNTNNKTLLPSGIGTVTKVGDIFVISVMWDDERKGVTGTGCDPTNPDDMKCFQLRLRLQV